MEYLWICLVALLGLALGDESCPPAKNILPCTCDDEGMNCMNARNLDQIKKAFRALFPYMATRSIWVQDTPITSLPAGLFGIIKSQQFYIEANNITSVDLKAFSESNQILMILSFYGNQIVDFPYTGLSQFQRLSSLNLGGNKIKQIPDNAFDSRSLFTLILGKNQIKNIGANAFSNLPSLARLELSNNEIETLGPMSLAMKQHAEPLQINLSDNKIKDISMTAFQGVDPLAIFFANNQLTSLKKDVFLPLVMKVAQKGGYLDVSGNPLSCKGCDYSWIVQNKRVLATKLAGFRCTDGRSILDLTKSSIEC